MAERLDIVVHGRGNAWPVPLGEDHPFYNRKDPADLSNASYSLELRSPDNLLSSVLIDAGHGTVQSLLGGVNTIPACICLTHGHLDHTLSVDWVVQSYWRKHGKEKPYPIYSSLPVYRFMIRSFPHLEELTEHRELEFGQTVAPGTEMPFRLTCFPVYHGQSAVGASMFLFEYGRKKIVFTGDILVPLLKRKDYDRLTEADLLVVDTNNRFPWPRTNHWSFAGSCFDPLKRNHLLESYAEDLRWEQAAAPHLVEGISKLNLAYLSGVEKEWKATDAPLSILEFIKLVRPKQTMLVHYSGTEDRKYNGEEILSGTGLQEWTSETLRRAGIPGNILVPSSGQRIQLN